MQYFFDVYSKEKVIHNGHILKDIEYEEIKNNNDIVFLKKKQYTNGKNKAFSYKNPKYFRKTLKQVHFRKPIISNANTSNRGMPIIPVDSLFLHNKRLKMVSQGPRLNK